MLNLKNDDVIEALGRYDMFNLNVRPTSHGPIIKNWSNLPEVNNLTGFDPRSYYATHSERGRETVQSLYRVYAVQPYWLDTDGLGIIRLPFADYNGITTFSTNQVVMWKSKYFTYPNVVVPPPGAFELYWLPFGSKLITGSFGTNAVVAGPASWMYVQINPNTELPSCWDRYNYEWYYAAPNVAQNTDNEGEVFYTVNLLPNGFAQWKKIQTTFPQNVTPHFFNMVCVDWSNLDPALFYYPISTPNVQTVSSFEGGVDTFGQSIKVANAGVIPPTPYLRLP